MSPHVLAETTRRDTATDRQIVESRHHGNLVVVGPDGAVAAALGDPDRPTFVRSAAKPFQAAASLELAGDLAAALTDAELAVGWASHRGEPRHLEAVTLLLERSGTDPEALTTPPARTLADPGGPERRVHHNCSGKHALFALAGIAVGCPRERLLDPGGPVQRSVLATLADACGTTGVVAVDGCGAPAVQAPLVGLARAFRALWFDDRWERVRAAGLAQPGLVGGEGRLESALLAAGILAKPGAEGVFGASWYDDRGVWGVAIKVEDGAGRAAAATLHRLLVDLEVVHDGAWSGDPVLGGGEPQGVVRATDEVHELARRLAVARG